MKLLKTEEVASMLNVSVSHFNQHIKTQSIFPKPLKLTPKARPQWRDVDIVNWLNEKVAA
jgi:predicted DNA-binding transcriptional regulator AlpA